MKQTKSECLMWIGINSDYLQKKIEYVSKWIHGLWINILLINMWLISNMSF